MHASHFDKVITLFETKWDSKVHEFVTYFFETWIHSTFHNWYRGAVPIGFSHTNNGIEGFNNGLKSKYTDWEKFTMEEFIPLCRDVIVDYSVKTSQKSFPVTLFLNETVIKKAEIMVDDPFLMIGNGILYWKKLDGMKNREKVTHQMVAKYTDRKKTRSLKTFRESVSLWYVKVGENIQETECTYPKFRLYAYCKHVLVALWKLDKIDKLGSLTKKQLFVPNKKRGR